jgi:hypothetical protein
MRKCAPGQKLGFTDEQIARLRGDSALREEHIR